MQQILRHKSYDFIIAIFAYKRPVIRAKFITLARILPGKTITQFRPELYMVFIRTGLLYQNYDIPDHQNLFCPGSYENSCNITCLSIYYNEFLRKREPSEASHHI